MKGLIICKELKDKIKSKNSLVGRVNSVFKNAVNIKTEEELITILSKNRSIQLFSIVVDYNEDFISCGIREGMIVIIEENSLRLEDLNLKIDLTKSETWKREIIINSDKSSKEEYIYKLMILENYIYKYGKHGGFSPIIFNIGKDIEKLKNFKSHNVEMNIYSRYIYKQMVDFLICTYKMDLENVNEKASKIIGFGPGLTPSGDDFISGVMISLLYNFKYYNYNMKNGIDLNKKMMLNIEGKTSWISEQLIKTAAEGKVSENIHKGLHSLFNQAEEEDYKQNILNILHFGCTSGTDTLCGIYSICRLMLN